MVYRAARRSALATTGRAVKKLDELYAKDAEKLKRDLRKLFKISGVPERRANTLIDEAFRGSRAERVKVVEAAVREAATTGHGMDKATFDAVFGGDRDAAVPFETGRSASPQKRTPSLRLLRGSEDEST